MRLEYSDKNLMISVLQKEEALYEKNKHVFLKNGEGKYVVIQDDTILRFFETQEDALKEGYRQFNADKPFLVRKVSSVEDLHYFSPSPTY